AVCANVSPISVLSLSGTLLNRRKWLPFNPALTFLRRFLMHVLPDGFQRIRHYGLLGNRHRVENLARCRELLAMPESVPQPSRDYRERYKELSGHDLLLCPQCRTGTMVRIGFLPAGNTLPRFDSS